ncbi:hypothetical protein Asi02nite_02010 [Asanoa siamensis]|uniref:Uncharacterized protein n=1 Tax=Asanoa siamensis TaxID=926357 RepID=A0ABQ4CHC1_9ACTN|nr:hypothetical protein Asi02nite_02010 [Asanoa siamensis]
MSGKPPPSPIEGVIAIDHGLQLPFPLIHNNDPKPTCGKQPLHHGKTGNKLPGLNPPHSPMTSPPLLGKLPLTKISPPPRGPQQPRNRTPQPTRFKRHTESMPPAPTPKHPHPPACG